MRFRIFERTSNIQHRTLNVELRSEEHTSELQSRLHLVCRLLLEKKKKTSRNHRLLLGYKSHNSSVCGLSFHSQSLLLFLVRSVVFDASARIVCMSGSVMLFLHF